MYVKILIGILIADLVTFVVLLFLSCSKEFLTWCARKDDPEWAKEYDKYQKDFLRLKSSQGGSAKWGDT
jgi:hypothetical protein